MIRSFHPVHIGFCGSMLAHEAAKQDAPIEVEVEVQTSRIERQLSSVPPFLCRLAHPRRSLVDCGQQRVLETSMVLTCLDNKISCSFLKDFKSLCF